jgi:lysophospholipase L1-like esterase
MDIIEERPKVATRRTVDLPHPRPRPRRAEPAGPPKAPRRPRRSLASAGRCIGVGLVCFAVWLLFDANQLYRSAESSPLGARRTAAMIILRPIAAVTNALGISSLVNGADDALGRQNGPGADSGPTNFNPTVPPAFDGVIGSFNGILPAPHRIYGFRLPHYVPPAPVGPPPVPQPTAARPLVMVDIGDSLGEDLGFGLGDQFGSNSLVALHQQSVEDTGLARPDYYDWPAHLEQYLQKWHPKVVVAMFGGNDAQNFIQDNKVVTFGSALWRVDYAERVAQIMDEVTASGAHLLWVGMPIMQDAGFAREMEQLNAIYAAQAAKHPGVTYFSAWKLFSDSSGHYSAYLTTPSGQQIEARDPDGVHIAPAGWDYLAASLVRPMESAWHISFGH